LLDFSLLFSTWFLFILAGLPDFYPASLSIRGPRDAGIVVVETDRWRGRILLVASMADRNFKDERANDLQCCTLEGVDGTQIGGNKRRKGVCLMDPSLPHSAHINWVPYNCPADMRKIVGPSACPGERAYDVTYLYDDTRTWVVLEPQNRDFGHCGHKLKVICCVYLCVWYKDERVANAITLLFLQEW